MIKDIHITPDITISKSHYYCDYIELIALVNNDILTHSDISDIFYEDGRIKVKKDLKDENLSTNKFKIDNKWKSIITSWFRILNLREELFKLSYPFLIKNNSIKLKLNLSIQQKVYIFLLLNSNQKYLNKHKNLLTSDFEELSLIVLKNYLPIKALSYRFGKSMLNYDRYEGKLINKIDLLAEDLKYKIQYDKDDFDENDNGDGGLDLISWIPFENDENQNNMQVILCQCATGKEWFKKQYETEKFTSNFINFRTTVNKVVFIPYDGRQENRRFTEQKEILNDVWLFDRIRILNLLKKNNHKEILSLKSFDVVVDKMIDFEEDII